MPRFSVFAFVLAIAWLTLAWGMLPDPVNVRSCEWVDGRMRLAWEAPAGILVDYYEVQVSGSPGGQPFSIFSTGAQVADIDSLLPRTTYWVRVRGHAQGAPSLGPGTWGQPGNDKECRTGDTPKRSIALSGTHVAESTVLEVMRESEFTNDVDYLMNHNSGSILGDVAFLTLSSTDPSKPNFLNVSLVNATFTVFCVDMMSVSIPDTVTTGGDTTFADYVSCDDNGNPTDPQCDCDNWIDRKIGGLDVNKYCHTADGSICQPTSQQSMKMCHCNCTTSSLNYSSRYTGMMPVKFGGKTVGEWYSHPKATECAESERLGDRRADGSVCTWKRRPAARVLRGWQALAAGWNATKRKGFFPDPAQIEQNFAIIRKTLDSQPVLPWQCRAPTLTDIMV